MRALFLESRLLDPYENLAVEEAALHAVAPGEVALYLWRNERTVVIGRNQNPWRECRVAELERDGGRLARRPSGGGAVYHDAGNLNFTFVAGEGAYDIARQMGVVVAALRALGVEAQLTGRNDIEADGAKVSGNAFFRTPGAQLHHGTLMVAVDAEALARYLSPDPRKLAAKGVSSVRSRVANLADLAPGVTVDTLREALREAFSAEYGAIEPFPAEPLAPDEVAARRERFASREWLFGRTLPFTHAFGARFDWGSADVELDVEKGAVREARVWSDALDADWIEALGQALAGCPYEVAALSGRVGALPADTPDQKRMRADCRALMEANA